MTDIYLSKEDEFPLEIARLKEGSEQNLMDKLYDPFVATLTEDLPDDMDTETWGNIALTVSIKLSGLIIATIAKGEECDLADQYRFADHLREQCNDTLKSIISELLVKASKDA